MHARRQHAERTKRVSLYIISKSGSYGKKKIFFFFFFDIMKGNYDNSKSKLQMAFLLIYDGDHRWGCYDDNTRFF